MDSRGERHHGTLVSAPDLHAALARALTSLRRPDGGLPMSVEGASEVEPTALAALALDDAGARRWLATRQRPDGGFEELQGRSDGPTTAALVALALDDRVAARRSLAYALAQRGLPLPDAADPDRRTAVGLDGRRPVARRADRTRPYCRQRTDAERRGDPAEALGLLTARQCADGGWNFGTASVYAVDLRGYAQTTAMALIALQRGASGRRRAGVRLPARHWPLEPGGLTVAQAFLAFRLHGRRTRRPPRRRASSDLTAPLVPRAAARRRLGDPRHRPDALLDPLRSRA